jgi:dCTP deaminase
MIIKSHEIAKKLNEPDPTDPMVITPKPLLKELEKAGTASVDLRLGTWIASLRQSRISHLDVSNASDLAGEGRLTRQYYVPFGERFILHPQYFILGATLEWIRLPKDIAGYVIGKSSWGRRGLVIATAVGVHPGFAGCLTLEIGNLGEIPVAIRPGMQICQLFLHTASSDSPATSRSAFVGQRKPRLGTVKVDAIAEALMKANQ